MPGRIVETTAGQVFEETSSDPVKQITADGKTLNVGRDLKISCRLKVPEATTVGEDVTVVEYRLVTNAADDSDVGYIVKTVKSAHGQLKSFYCRFYWYPEAAATEESGATRSAFLINDATHDSSCIDVSVRSRGVCVCGIPRSKIPSTLRRVAAESE